MLSPKEKKEMLCDAGSKKRRISFRVAKNKDPLSSFDEYLRFLSQVQKMFTKASDEVQKPPQARLKL